VTESLTIICFDKGEEIELNNEKTYSSIELDAFESSPSGDVGQEQII